MSSLFVKFMRAVTQKTLANILQIRSLFVQRRTREGKYPASPNFLGSSVVDDSERGLLLPPPSDTIDAAACSIT